MIIILINNRKGLCVQYLLVDIRKCKERNRRYGTDRPMEPIQDWVGEDGSLTGVRDDMRADICYLDLQHLHLTLVD